MNRRNQLGTTFVVLAAVLFVVPALFPVQPVLAHETWGSTTGGPEELEAEGYEIIAYENLSDRGQELYVRTLQNGNDYTVPLGEGAPEFPYPAQDERARAAQNDDRSALRGVVIERPEDDSDLPPPSEPRFEPREEKDDELSDEERQQRQMAERYEVIHTFQDEPPLGATPQLLRLAAVLLAVVSLGLGGYLLSSK